MRSPRGLSRAQAAFLLVSAALALATLVVGQDSNSTAPPLVDDLWAPPPGVPDVAEPPPGELLPRNLVPESPPNPSQSAECRLQLVGGGPSGSPLRSALLQCSTPDGALVPVTLGKQLMDKLSSGGAETTEDPRGLVITSPFVSGIVASLRESAATNASSSLGEGVDVGVTFGPLATLNLSANITDVPLSRTGPLVQCVGCSYFNLRDSNMAGLTGAATLHGLSYGVYGAVHASGLLEASVQRTNCSNVTGAHGWSALLLDYDPVMDIDFETGEIFDALPVRLSMTDSHLTDTAVVAGGMYGTTWAPTADGSANDTAASAGYGAVVMRVGGPRAASAASLASPAALYVVLSRSSMSRNLGGRGGAMSIIGTQAPVISVFASSLDSNTASAGDGGAVWVAVGRLPASLGVGDLRPTLALSGGSTLSMNSAAQGDGGGLWTNVPLDLTLADGSTAADNYAGGNSGGGAAFIGRAPPARAAAKAAAQRNPEMTDGKGGIKWDLALRVRLSGGSRLLRNTAAAGGGGAVAVADVLRPVAVQVFATSLVEGNTAAASGGAVLVSGCGPQGQRHDGGRSAAAASRCPVALQVTGRSCLRENAAQGLGSGGALAADGALGLLTLSGDSCLSGNSASMHGGAVYAARGVLYGTVSGAMDDNSALLGDGGALAAGPGSRRLELTLGASVSNNAAGGRGGGLYLAGGVRSLQVTGAVISGNRAGADGGGIALSGPVSWALMDNVTMTGNAAGGSGGGLWHLANGALLHPSSLRITDSVLQGNAALGGSGGATASILLPETPPAPPPSPPSEPGAAPPPWWDYDSPPPPAYPAEAPPPWFDPPAQPGSPQSPPSPPAYPPSPPSPPKGPGMDAPPPWWDYESPPPPAPPLEKRKAGLDAPPPWWDYESPPPPSAPGVPPPPSAVQGLIDDLEAPPPDSIPPGAPLSPNVWLPPPAEDFEGGLGPNPPPLVPPTHANNRRLRARRSLAVDARPRTMQYTLYVGNSIMSQNTALQSGGAVYVAADAVLVRAAVQIVGTMVSGNGADGSGAPSALSAGSLGGGGGGLFVGSFRQYAADTTAPTAGHCRLNLTDVRADSNNAGGEGATGGAVLSVGCMTDISGCAMTDNHARSAGGAVAVIDRDAPAAATIPPPAITPAAGDLISGHESDTESAVAFGERRRELLVEQAAVARRRQLVAHTTEAQAHGADTGPRWQTVVPDGQHQSRLYDTVRTVLVDRRRLAAAVAESQATARRRLDSHRRALASDASPYDGIDTADVSGAEDVTGSDPLAAALSESPRQRRQRRRRLAESAADGAPPPWDYEPDSPSQPAAPSSSLGHGLPSPVPMTKSGAASEDPSKAAPVYGSPSPEADAPPPWWDYDSPPPPQWPMSNPPPWDYTDSPPSAPPPAPVVRHALVIASSMFLINSVTGAGPGGAVYVLTSDAIQLTGDTFNNNTASTGGALAAVQLYGTDLLTDAWPYWLRVSSCSLLGNVATLSDGGAIRVEASTASTVLVQTSSMESNSASFGSGGGLALVPLASSRDTTTARRRRLWAQQQRARQTRRRWLLGEGDEAWTAGGDATVSVGSLVLDGLTMWRNSAQGSGGAILASAGTPHTVTLTGCSLLSNRVSAGGGGAIAVDAPPTGGVPPGAWHGPPGGPGWQRDVALSGLTLGSNTAWGAGGALLVSSHAARVSISSCSLSNNVAGGHGGAIAVLAAPPLLPAPLRAPAAPPPGGRRPPPPAPPLALAAPALATVRLAVPSTLDLTIDTSKASNNKAGGSGGAVLLLTANGSLTVTATTFTSNAAAAGGGAAAIVAAGFTRPPAPAVDAPPPGFESPLPAEPTYSLAVQFESNTLTENTGGDGDGGGFLLAVTSPGAGAAVPTVDATLGESYFTSNAAQGSGGAVAVLGLGASDGSALTLRSCAMTSNSAGGAGGGVAVALRRQPAAAVEGNNGTQIFLGGCTMASNTANVSGGGASLGFEPSPAAPAEPLPLYQRPFVRMQDGLCIDNVVDVSPTVSVAGSTPWRPGFGGCVSVDGYFRFRARTTTVSGNTLKLTAATAAAGGGGGGVYAGNGAVLSIIESYLSLNEVTLPAAVSWDTNPLNAGGAGGSILARRCGALEVLSSTIENSRCRTGAGGGIHAFAVGAVSIEQTHITGSSAAIGGGCFISAPSSTPTVALVYGSWFVDDVATGLTVGSNGFTGGLDGYGGGLALDGIVSAAVLQSDLATGNAATSQGSAIASSQTCGPVSSAARIADLFSTPWEGAVGSVLGGTWRRLVSQLSAANKTGACASLLAFSDTRLPPLSSNATSSTPVTPPAPVYGGPSSSNPASTLPSQLWARERGVVAAACHSDGARLGPPDGVPGTGLLDPEQEALVASQEIWLLTSAIKGRLAAGAGALDSDTQLAACWALKEAPWASRPVQAG
ncbi:hypothetical protein HYH03_003600 [Edaphochlamys debaryana]|uniref:Right handed beta helix domain-containing protein n=1 Tax=Edaphochlamys debaryana TaxID=47281 RepID=A0A836C2S7_9CHLO|nr:hypothetical protein HYH03_003600 [Edaphochlamys debaryana]|eukprot:KAG2498341.1 hypothetical protein HYH03_003600 [Edaphochlamys debaryana]